MPQQTSNFATFANDTTVGTVAWTNMSNAQTSNNVYATAALGSGLITNYLKCTNPSGLSIPSDAVIVGIEIMVERHTDKTPTNDYSVRLVKDGTIQGDNKASATNWPESDQVITYGSPSDLWGLSWTPSDFGSGFGVVISVKSNVGGTQPQYVDHVYVTVTYQTGITLDEAQTLLDYLSTLTGKNLSETISLSDLAAMLTSIARTENLTFNDIIEAIKIRTAILSETLALGDTITISWLYNLLIDPETFSLYDTILPYTFRDNKPLRRYQPKLLITLNFEVQQNVAAEDIYVVE